MLHINTSGVQHIETLTLVGQGEGGTDLTETYTLEPNLFRIEGAGRLILYTPTFNPEDPFGTQLFRLSGAFSFEISQTGLEAFVKCDLEIGPEDVRLLDFDALGVMKISNEGFFGDIQIGVSVGDSPAIRDWFSFEMFARMVFNVTGDRAEVKISDRMLDYLTDDFKARLVTCSNEQSIAKSCYVVDSRPPVCPDGTQGPVGGYFVIQMEGHLTIAQVFRLYGSFYLEVNSEQFYVDVKASLALEPLVTVAVAGTLCFGREARYGSLQIAASLGMGPFLLSGAAQFEFNTLPYAVNVQRFEYDFETRRVTDRLVQATLPSGYFRIYVAGYLGLEGFVELKGTFELVNDADVLRLHVDASFEVMTFDILKVNGDAVIVKNNDPGLVVNLFASMNSPLDIEDVFELNAQFRLEVNTRGGSGQDEFDFGVPRSSFYVSFDGEANLLSLIKLEGHGYIRYKDGLFQMDVNMSTNILGSGIAVSGFLSSEGEFLLDLRGQMMVGVPGFGLRGYAAFHISRLDDNGKDPYGDLNFVLDVFGEIGASLDLFGISIVGTNLAFGYNSDVGRVWVNACVNFLAWQACGDFTIMHIKPPPKVYLAGNADDQEGQAFRGGACT